MMRSVPAIRAVPALALALLAAGCGARSETPAPPSIVELRERADDAPRDAAVQRWLSEAEMFYPGGDPKRVGPQLDRALALSERDPRLRLLSALHADAHGEPGRALSDLLTALGRLPADPDPLAGLQAEFAVHAVAGLAGSVPGFTDRVARALARVVHDLPAPARWAATDLLVRLALARGDRSAARVWADRAGCLPSLRAAGPFGPRDLLSFDQDQGVDVGQPLADRYDLGPRRGEQPTRTVEAVGCSVHLGGDSLGNGGSRYAQAVVHLDDPEQVLRLDTPNAFELFIDGQPILRLDRRRASGARAVFRRLSIAPGEHLVTVKVASRHPNPVLSLAFLPAGSRDEARALSPPKARHPSFELFLRAGIQMVRGDPVAARMTLQPATEDRDASPYLFVQRASVALSDPLLPEDVGADRARTMLQRALDRDPDLWSPLLQLATMAANNGQVREAIEGVRALSERFPKVVAIRMAHAELLRSQGWDEAANAQVEQARELVPDACGPLSAQLSALLDRRREADAVPVIDALMACDARSHARYAQLVRRRDWAGAVTELSRLRALSSSQSRYSYLLSALDLAKQRGDVAARKTLIATLRAGFAQSEEAILSEIDAHLERGAVRDARRTLDGALSQAPGPLVGLLRLRPVLGGAHPLAPYRRDGLAAIRAYEASDRVYEGPQVLVFDYMALRLFEAGSSAELVHTVQRAQSVEAVDEMAEVSIPDGARILTLRVVKADGALLEPDAIAGKDTISMPNVAVGDYVELEYIREVEPPEGFPRGFVSDRFYFRSFEVPFDHSEMVVISPAELPLEVDPRGAAPQVEEVRRRGLVERRFAVDQSPALTQEPGSVAPREYVPSIRVGHGADWTEFVQSMREMLADRSVVDPALRELTGVVIGETEAQDSRQRVARLYDFVLDRVENNDDVFSQAAAMLRARQGNRARVLHYLLGLAGVSADLVLVRSALSDRTKSDLSDGDTYEHLLLRVDAGDEPLWLFTAETHAPFGYIPPLLRGQPGIVLVEGAPAARVPKGPEGAELRSLDVDIALSDDGSAKVKVVERLRGAGAISWRNQLEAVPEVELSRRFEEEYAARLLPGARLLDLEVTGRDREHEVLTLRYELALSALARRTPGGWAVPPLFSAELAANYASLPERTTTAFTGPTVETEVVLRLRPPSGAVLAAPPEPVRLVGPADQATFVRSARMDGDALVLRRSLQLPSMRVSTDAYPAFARFCREVDAAEDLEITYSR